MLIGTYNRASMRLFLSRVLFLFYFLKLGLCIFGHGMSLSGTHPQSPALTSGEVSSLIGGLVVLSKEAQCHDYEAAAGNIACSLMQSVFIHLYITSIAASIFVNFI